MFETSFCGKTAAAGHGGTLKTKTVYVLKLRSGMKLMWYVDENTKRRVPVVRHGHSRARLVYGRTANLGLCSVLDAVMDERRQKSYPPDGVKETSARVKRTKMQVLGNRAIWLPADWAVIAFTGQDIHLDHYQKSIDGTRKSLRKQTNS